jgi:transcriptional regulator with XRE-family HTH domain
MTIGEKIRCIRHLRGLKQESVAEQLGMSVNGYGKIERNEGHVSVDRLEQIARVFELDVKDIFDFNSDITSQQAQNLQSARADVFRNSVTADERKLYELTIASLRELLKMKDEMIEEIQKRK